MLDDVEGVDLNKQVERQLNARASVKLIIFKPKMEGTTAFQSNITGTAPINAPKNKPINVKPTQVKVSICFS